MDGPRDGDLDNPLPSLLPAEGDSEEAVSVVEMPLPKGAGGGGAEGTCAEFSDAGFKVGAGGGGGTIDEIAGPAACPARNGGGGGGGGPALIAGRSFKGGVGGGGGGGGPALIAGRSFKGGVGGGCGVGGVGSLGGVIIGGGGGVGGGFPFGGNGVESSTWKGESLKDLSQVSTRDIVPGALGKPLKDG